jgi:hypothetical protein
LKIAEKSLLGPFTCVSGASLEKGAVVILRNADLGKSMPVATLIDILDAFAEDMGDRSAIFESNRWISPGEGWEPATPEEVYEYIQDRVSELRLSILSEVEL